MSSFFQGVPDEALFKIVCSYAFEKGAVILTADDQLVMSNFYIQEAITRN